MAQTERAKRKDLTTTARVPIFRLEELIGAPRLRGGEKEAPRLRGGEKEACDRHPADGETETVVHRDYDAAVASAFHATEDPPPEEIRSSGRFKVLNGMPRAAPSSGRWNTLVSQRPFVPPTPPSGTRLRTSVTPDEKRAVRMAREAARHAKAAARRMRLVVLLIWGTAFALVALFAFFAHSS